MKSLGLGWKVFATKFEMMNAEENSRYAMADFASAWRKCIFLSEYLERVEVEGRCADEKVPSERLMKAMIEDCTQTEDWSSDTLGRYLHIGQRLGKDTVRKRLIVWEAMYKRNQWRMKPHDGLSEDDAAVKIQSGLYPIRLMAGGD